MEIGKFKLAKADLVRPPRKPIQEQIIPQEKPYTEDMFREEADLYLKGFIGGFPQDEMLLKLQAVLDKAAEKGVVEPEAGLDYFRSRKQELLDFARENHGETLPRINKAIGGGVIEGEDLENNREGYKNPGINTRKDLAKVENYLDEDKFVKLRIENKDKTNKEFADFLNKEGYKPDPKQAEKFSPISIDRRYNVAKKKGLIPEDFVYAGSTAAKSITEADRKEYKQYIKERFPDKYENVLKLSDKEINKKISDRRKLLNLQADDAKREAKILANRKYRYETSRGLRGEEAQKKYEEYVLEKSRERRKNLNKYYRNPRDPKSLLWEDLLKRNEQALDKPFSYDKKLPIKRYLDKNETQKIVLTDKQGNQFKYDTLLEDIEKATNTPSDQVLKPYAQKSFLYQENLMPEINKQFGLKPGARDNPFHIQHIEGFQQNPFNVQLTFGDQNLAEARGKLSLESTFKNILKKEQKSPSYQEGTLYNYNKKKKAINKFYGSLGPDIATKIGKKEVGTRTALVDLLDKTKVKIKPEVRERAMTLGAMGDVEMAKDILSKDFQTAKKLFGKYAPQIARGARQVSKFAVIPELALGAAFAPLDLGEGRSGKETLLNVATLGMGVPISDARDRANYVDQFGLKEDLFSAQMKQAGAQYGAPALTEREQLALQKAEEFDTQILQPRLEKTLRERQAASDPNFGTGIMGMANGGRIGFADGFDPKRRKFFKTAAGIASIPVFGRMLKPVAKGIEAAGPAVEKVATEAEKIFFNLVDAVKSKGIMDKLDKVTGGRLSGAYHKYKDAEVLEDAGSITAKFKTDKGAPAEIVYVKPQKRIDPKTGREVEYPGEFDYEAQEIARINPEGDVDIDAEFEIIDSIEDVKKLIDD